MKTIPIETVEEVWERLNALTADEAQEVAQRNQERQPFIMVYLLAVDETQVEEDSYGQLLELGAFVLEVMHTANPHLHQVSDVDLDNAETANVHLLQRIEEGSETDFANGVENLVSQYNQMPLLGAIIQSLMAGYEEEPDSAPDHIGLGLIYLKTIIDCLDQ